jgi:hypothetical protein
MQKPCKNRTVSFFFGGFFSGVADSSIVHLPDDPGNPHTMAEPRMLCPVENQIDNPVLPDRAKALKRGAIDDFDDKLLKCPSFISDVLVNRVTEDFGSTL